MLRNTASNILLLRDDVGMPKPTTRELPAFGHAYGLQGTRDPHNVAACKFISVFLMIFVLVTSKWVPHNNSRQPKYEKNFKQTNKLAIKERATTARAQRAFR